MAKVTSVHVVAPDVDGPTVSQLSSSGIEVSTRHFTGPTAFNRLRKRHWLRCVANQRIEQLQPKLLHGGAYTLDIIGRVSRRHGIPFTVEVQAYEDLPWVRYEAGLRETFKRRVLALRRGPVLYALGKSRCILTPSSFMEHVLRQWVPEAKPRIVRPVIDLPLRAWRALPEPGRFTVGMVNPTIAKGRELFLSLARERPSWDFVYFGMQELSGAPDNVRLGGWFVDPTELYSQVSVMVVPSIWPEPLGRVSVEAVRCGKPVLVSDTGGLPETVDASLVIQDYREPSAWLARLDDIKAHSLKSESAWRKSVAAGGGYEAKTFEREVAGIYSTLLSGQA